MRYFKDLIRKIISFTGYEIHKSSGQQVSINNFTSLAQAYEQRLKDLGTQLLRNENRIRLLSRLQGTPPPEAYFIVLALEGCKNIEGDICEFGVAQGETSTLIANEILSCNKTLHLFDSFMGLSKPSQKDQLKDDIASLGNIQAYTGTMSYPEQMVRSRLKELSFPSQRLVIHKGFIDKVLDYDFHPIPKEVSFAYVDFDLYEPTKITLEYLHRTTTLSAIIIIDDYNFFSTGVKTAVDEFLKREKYEFINL